MLLIGLFLSAAVALADDTPLIIPASHQCTLEHISSEPKRAFEECLTFAQLGYADAQFVLGEYWYQGHHAPRDYQQALKWFEQASVQGHAIAQLRLGTMFFFAAKAFQPIAFRPTLCSKCRLSMAPMRRLIAQTK